MGATGAGFWSPPPPITPLIATWWGDEMPELNGEWEWLVCCSADFGRRG